MMYLYIIKGSTYNVKETLKRSYNARWDSGRKAWCIWSATKPELFQGLQEIPKLGKIWIKVEKHNTRHYVSRDNM